MSYDQDSAESELSNKEETEIPIGEPQEPERRESNMWRCRGCGEMGKFDGTLPEECPGCAAPKEDLYYWEED
ncbi:hypothetical protein GS429_09425 [Natronorubrum sp. JWXQ-INN-674]|uniref:DUF7130 domain-containing protein n=1 Tax=Natronorubrum halalkaliphilum TaxID=2691917 RepID=A0A6B0VL66_9EURY|nr:hypothetical protein [Natronorubrum halalkaliphilum]MXV62278.1 hypothetical protein [Natronorubrum halalkaliphilum]